MVFNFWGHGSLRESKESQILSRKLCTFKLDQRSVDHKLRTSALGAVCRAHSNPFAQGECVTLLCEDNLEVVLSLVSINQVQGCHASFVLPSTWLSAGYIEQLCCQVPQSSDGSSAENKSSGLLPPSSPSRELN